LVSVKRRTRRRLIRFLVNGSLLLAAILLGLALLLGLIDRGAVADRAANALDYVRPGALIPPGGRGDSGSRRHTDEACTRACRANLARIDSAKKRAARRTGFTTGSVSRSLLAEELGGRVPECPCGGHYTIGSLEQYPACTGLPGG
jgi:hypothetical protein